MKQRNPDVYPFWRFWAKELITREDGKPYLYRTTIIGIGKWFSIKYHKVVVSDDACLHDHPWSFLSIILKGGYWEHTYVNEKDQAWLSRFRAERIGNYFKAPDGRWVVRKFYKPGSILWRRSPSTHRLELPLDKDGTPIPCHTLVFTGRVFRKWGFYTKLGWIYWRDYSKNKYC